MGLCIESGIALGIGVKNPRKRAEAISEMNEPPGNAPGGSSAQASNSVPLTLLGLPCRRNDMHGACQCSFVLSPWSLVLRRHQTSSFNTGNFRRSGSMNVRFALAEWSRFFV